MYVLGSLLDRPSQGNVGKHTFFAPLLEHPKAEFCAPCCNPVHLNYFVATFSSGTIIKFAEKRHDLTSD